MVGSGTSTSAGNAARIRGKSEPFVWTAIADEILDKVRLVQTNVKKLIQNNSK
jgi:hypothetical protein